MPNPLTMWYDPSTYGFGGGSGKEAERQADIARQGGEAQSIAEQVLAQLAPGSDEYNQYVAFAQEMLRRIAEGPFAVGQLGGAVIDQQEALSRFGQQLVSQQQQRIASGGPATPAEARTQQAFEGFRQQANVTPYEQDILDALAGGPVSSPSGRVFQDVVQQAEDPDAFYLSTLQPQLQQAEDFIGQRYAQRGLLGSGLQLESLGRAGVDLAVKEAEARMANRQRALQNLQALSDVGQGLRARQIGVEESLTNLQSGRESRLTDLLASQSQSSLGRLNDLLSRREQAATVANLAEQQSGDQTGQLLGRGLGTVAGLVVGSQFGNPALGASIGSSLLTGQPISAGSYLYGQQLNPSQNLSAGLSRQAVDDEDEDGVLLNSSSLRNSPTRRRLG